MTPPPSLVVIAAQERDCGSDINDIAACTGTLPLVGIGLLWTGVVVGFVLLPIVLLTTSVVPYLGSWFERFALGLGPETPVAPPQTAPSQVPAPGTLPPSDVPQPGVPAEPQIAPEGVPPPGDPETPGSQPGVDTPVVPELPDRSQPDVDTPVVPEFPDRQPSADIPVAPEFPGSQPGTPVVPEPSPPTVPAPVVEPSTHGPHAPAPGSGPGYPVTTGPNAAAEGPGNEEADPDPGDKPGEEQDIPERFYDGYQPGEDDLPLEDLTPEQLDGHQLLSELDTITGDIRPRAEDLANLIAQAAEQPDPDRVAFAQMQVARKADEVQDLPAIVLSLLEQILSNGAVVPDDVAKPGLRDKAIRAMAMVDAVVNELNKAKAATEQLTDPRDMVRAVKKLVPAAKEAEKKIGEFIASARASLGGAPELDALAKAHFDLWRRIFHPDAGFLLFVPAIAEWVKRRRRSKELNEKWDKEDKERAAREAGETDDDAERDDDGPADGDGGPKGGR